MVVIIVFRGRLTSGEVRKPKQRWMNEGAWTPNPEMPHPRAHSCFPVGIVTRTTVYISGAVTWYLVLDPCTYSSSVE